MLTFVLIVSLVIYLLPTLIAVSRGRAEEGIVIGINILLGWTAIGWIVAFVLACTGKTNRDLKLEAQRHHEVVMALRGPQQPQPALTGRAYWDSVSRHNMRR